MTNGDLFERCAPPPRWRAFRGTRSRHIETMGGLSAHADGAELVAYTHPLKGAAVHLGHGEGPAAAAHQKALLAAGFANVTIAHRGNVAEV